MEGKPENKRHGIGFLFRQAAGQFSMKVFGCHSRLICASSFGRLASRLIGSMALSGVSIGKTPQDGLAAGKREWHRGSWAASAC